MLRRTAILCKIQMESGGWKRNNELDKHNNSIIDFIKSKRFRFYGMQENRIDKNICKWKSMASRAEQTRSEEVYVMREK